jgi:GT2 family glycosyltransferase
MIDTLNRYTKAKGIPSLLLNPDGSPQRFKLKIFGLSEVHDSKVRLVHFPGTTACLYYTDVFKKVGFFDEFYFFYNEDLDFAIRAKRKGLIFVFNPKVRVIHHRAQGRKKGERFIRPYFYATNYYFYRKNFGFLLAQLYLAGAKRRICRMRKKFHKTNNVQQGELLEQGSEKLKHTVRHYRSIVDKSK